MSADNITESISKDEEKEIKRIEKSIEKEIYNLKYRNILSPIKAIIGR